MRKTTVSTQFNLRLICDHRTTSKNKKNGWKETFRPSKPFLFTKPSKNAKTFFAVLPFDAITVAPYMGEDSVRPFLAYENKWTIVLGLTSNKGSDDFQQLALANTGEFLFERVMQKVASWGHAGNLMFVVGATKAEAFQPIRAAFPEHFFLVPGVGAQGGSLEEVSKLALNREGGLLVNASRAIQYASSGDDFAEQAKIVAAQYHEAMKTLLQQSGL